MIKGLPTTSQDGLGRIGFTIAPSNSKRMYATVDAEKMAVYIVVMMGENHGIC